MNTIITTIFMSAISIMSTNLKVEESNFKEMDPEVASGYVITKYEVQLTSTGDEKVTIDQVWYKNAKVSWELLDSERNNVETIVGNNVYTLRGETKKRSGGAKFKSKPAVKEQVVSFDEDFVIKYKVEGSEEVKLLTIDKIK